MNRQLNYYLAQAHTTDPIRNAQRHRLAGPKGRRQRRPQTAMHRLIDPVSGAGTTSVPTATLGSSSGVVRVRPRSARRFAWACCEVSHPNKPSCVDGLDPRCAASTAAVSSPATASGTAESDG